MTTIGPLRTSVAWSALALAWVLALARVAAGAARRGLNLERSGAERADCPVVLARGSGRRTHYAPCGRFVRTTAARMMTKCAARTDPRAALLGAPEIAPAGLRLPRRWASGVRDAGAQTPLQRTPTQSAGVSGGRRSVRGKRPRGHKRPRANVRGVKSQYCCFRINYLCRFRWITSARPSEVGVDVGWAYVARW